MKDISGTLNIHTGTFSYRHRAPCLGWQSHSGETACLWLSDGLLICQKLLHEGIIGPCRIPLGLHDCDGLGERASLVLHDVSEQERRAAGDRCSAMDQSTAAGSPGRIDGCVYSVKILGRIPRALS